MVTIGQAQQLLINGGWVADAQDNMIGAIGDVFLDNRTGQPGWVTVQDGSAASAAAFAPLQDAEVTTHGLRVPYDKEAVRAAPRFSDAEVCLSYREETELHLHYGTGETTREETVMDADLTEAPTVPIYLWAARGIRSILSAHPMPAGADRVA